VTDRTWPCNTKRPMLCIGRRFVVLNRRTTKKAVVRQLILGQDMQLRRTTLRHRVKVRMTISGTVLTARIANEYSAAWWPGACRP
jgi:ABC-type molybdate transport system ATPase subunit